MRCKETETAIQKWKSIFLTGRNCTELTVERQKKTNYKGI